MGDNYRVHKTIYFGWVEFEEFLCDKIFKEKVTLLQEDFYYWEVETQDIDEHGNNITLSNLDVHHMLSDELGNIITSSHVDENGVWLVVEEEY